MEIPPPSFVGFFPKITETKPNWLKVDGVQEVCSVSLCISKAPEGWIQRWVHNELGFFPTEALAESVLEGMDEHFDLYAYRLYPLEFNQGEVIPFVVPGEEDQDLSSFEFLGFDPVSRSSNSILECSPLSCNHAASEFKVNRNCLIEGLEEVYRACVEISMGNYEPGPYYLFEVYRKIN
jgi:hypothetical protein